MAENKDYTKYSFWTAFVVLILLLGLSQLPAFKVGDKRFKRINILSDLLGNPTDSDLLMADEYFDTTFLAEHLPDTSFRPSEQPLPLSQEWNLASGEAAVQGGDRKIETSDKPVVEIEDFGEELPAMSFFCNAMQDTQRKRPVRIAVLGDSYIEGDIITADLREQLQGAFSGSGVGFVPFSSPVQQYRATTKQTASGWEVWSMIDREKAPEALRDKFSLSGIACLPQEGATSRIQGTAFRKYLVQANSVKLLFINTKNTTLSVVVNDEEAQLFAPKSAPDLQEITIKGAIRSLAVTLNNTEGFIGYGAHFEGKNGVTVDNYSIRGNSGGLLFSTNSVLNAQWDKLLHYDLIVLQYGLNVVSSGTLNYASYGKTMTKLIAYMRRCFPNSSILVMGIGDRSMLQDGEFVTMPGVYTMIEAQRDAARKAGVAFWNMFEAMGGTNSMVRFVERKWAAKDYTHIGYPGGKYIASALSRSLIYTLDHFEVETEEVDEWPHYVSPDSDSLTDTRPTNE